PMCMLLLWVRLLWRLRLSSLLLLLLLLPVLSGLTALRALSFLALQPCVLVKFLFLLPHLSSRPWLLCFNRRSHGPSVLVSVCYMATLCCEFLCSIRDRRL
ncbi:hypothetical protein Vretimale_5478, partial [Volvox reticuliferus]